MKCECKKHFKLRTTNHLLTAIQLVELYENNIKSHVAK